MVPIPFIDANGNRAFRYELSNIATAPTQPQNGNVHGGVGVADMLKIIETAYDKSNEFLMIIISHLDAESHEPYIELSQKVFALEKEIMKIDLVINTTTLEFQDLNNNSWPDVGETSLVLGKLYDPNTQEEIGIYRVSFIWGNWANSTEGTPTSLGTQVFDIRGNGTVVVVGDIVTDARNGNATGIPIPIAAAIAGGTSAYKGVSGTATITERFYDPGTALYLDVVLDTMRSAGSKETTRTTSLLD